MELVETACMAPVSSPGLTTVQQGCNHYSTVDSDFRAQAYATFVPEAWLQSTKCSAGGTNATCDVVRNFCVNKNIVNIVNKNNTNRDVCRAYCSWNRLDIAIVILSIIGIVLEEIKSGLIPINPTIIRAMRVLRIARGQLIMFLQLFCQSWSKHTHHASSVCCCYAFSRCFHFSSVSSAVYQICVS